VQVWFIRSLTHLLNCLRTILGSIDVVNTDDDDEVEFMIELRTSVNDGYTAVVQSLGRSHPHLVLPYIPEV